LTVGALGACGSSGSSDTSSENSTGTATAPSSSKQPGTGTGSNGSSQTRQQKGNAANESPSNAETAPLKVSGGGSGQFRVKGGDNSIQDFGEESDESELEEAAASLHDFLVARAEEDWPTACSHLTKAVAQQIQRLAQSSKLSGEGCAGILAAMTPSLPPRVQRESTIVDAGSLRSEGEQAFLIYRGAEGAVYAIPMKPEGGTWKVGALAATPIS
jgi:hypothetical protein